MLSASGSIGLPEPTAQENTLFDTTVRDPTPVIFKQSTARPWTTDDATRDESLIALGKEMVGSIVGPMPAKEFLELLPPTSLTMPSESAEGEPNLTEVTKEAQMYRPFVRILFILLYP